MNNKNLFWYGVGADLKKAVGVGLFVVGVLIAGLNNKFIGIGMIALGLLFIGKGLSQRFDYKMKSGTMVHRGDW